MSALRKLPNCARLTRKLIGQPLVVNHAASGKTKTGPARRRHFGRHSTPSSDSAGRSVTENVDHVGAGRRLLAA